MKKPLSLLRAEIEYRELIIGKTEKITMESHSDGSATITYTLSPTEGPFKSHRYPFKILIPHNYPFSPPKAICQVKVLHPSIDQLGRVCLNITREDWSIQQTLQAVIFGLSSIFYDVPLEEPLNKEAHAVLEKGIAIFTQEAEKVYRSNQ